VLKVKTVVLKFGIIKEETPKHRFMNWKTIL